jgi:hypothetical protein
MRTLDPAVTALFASGHAALGKLVKIEFASGTHAFNTTDMAVSHGGTDYPGTGGLGISGSIVDKAGELPTVTLAINEVDQDAIATALDEAGEVQGAIVTISTGIFDTTTRALADVERDWIGTGDVMDLQEDGETTSIEMACECKGVDLLRGTPSTYTDADQQALYPGDTAFGYVVSQADKPFTFPSREAYFQ